MGHHHQHPPVQCISSLCTSEHQQLATQLDISSEIVSSQQSDTRSQPFSARGELGACGERGGGGDMCADLCAGRLLYYNQITRPCAPLPISAPRRVPFIPILVDCYKPKSRDLSVTTTTQTHVCVIQCITFLKISTKDLNRNGWTAAAGLPSLFIGDKLPLCAAAAGSQHI